VIDFSNYDKIWDLAYFLYRLDIISWNTFDPITDLDGIDNADAFARRIVK
jgi:hypothetical protein